MLFVCMLSYTYYIYIYIYIYMYVKQAFLILHILNNENLNQIQVQKNT